MTFGIDNGETRPRDLAPWLDKGVFRMLRDSPGFAQGRVVDGSVEWLGEIDLSYEPGAKCLAAKPQGLGSTAASRA